MSYREKRKFPLRHKGFSPRAATGDYYERYNVYQNQKRDHNRRRLISQKYEVASTTVEENVAQVETCIYSDCPKSSPKKIRRGKRDKISCNQRKEPEGLKIDDDQENVLGSEENTVKLTTEDSS
jgi:hypothetical protein